MSSLSPLRRRSNDPERDEDETRSVLLDIVFRYIFSIFAASFSILRAAFSSDFRASFSHFRCSFSCLRASLSSRFDFRKLDD